MSAKKKNPIIHTFGESKRLRQSRIVSQVRLRAIGFQLRCQPRLLVRREPRSLRRALRQHLQNHQAECRRWQSFHQKQPLPPASPSLPSSPSSQPASEPITTELSGSAI